MKKGIFTTEFLVTIAAMVGSGFAAYIFASWFPLIGGQVIAIVYVASRSVVKKDHGSVRHISIKG